MEDLDKLIAAKGSKKLPKYNNSPKLVTLDLDLELQLCQFLPLINSERNGTSVGILSGIVSRIGRWHLKSFDRLNRKEKHFFILFFHSGGLSLQLPTLRHARKGERVGRTDCQICFVKFFLDLKI